MGGNKYQLQSTPTTRRIQLTIAFCSIIFTIGTTLQNFVIINPSLIETMMQMADTPNPKGQAPGFTNGFRLVGCIYIIGNALGILAFRMKSAILWWVILVVNVTQGLGFAMIPSSMWIAAMNEYGIWGILPSAITDGGAIILTFVMVYTMLKYRSTWGQYRVAA